MIWEIRLVVLILHKVTKWPKKSTLESLLDCKEIQPVSPKRNQSWILIRGTDAETEAPILWPPDMKNWLIRKDSDAGKDWRQEEKGTTEDEMVAWHRWLNGHEFEQAPGDGERQENLACCSLWGRTEMNRTEWLNNSSNKYEEVELWQMAWMTVHLNW